MFDVPNLKSMYDDAIKNWGQPPLSFALFDRRILFPRSMVAEQIECETGHRLSLKVIDEMERAGLFTWLGGAGTDGTELGVPLYVPSRIGVLAEREAQGWTRDELRDFVEWEEWVIDDCLGDEDLRYEDSDVVVLARHVRLDLENVNSEIWGRLPMEQQPPGWTRTSWNSALAELSDEELRAKRHTLADYLRRVEATDIASAPDPWRHHIGRAAFCIRFWEESVRGMLIASDRAKLEAGFSPAIQFGGEHALVPDPDELEEFGRVDWEGSLQSWRFLNDPDRFPLRLPGFVLVGGKVMLHTLLSPEDYARRHELFRLEDYVARFSEVAGARRCAYCTKLLKPSASERRRYCSAECSQAARQKAYRERQKAMILRNRT